MSTMRRPKNTEVVLPGILVNNGALTPMQQEVTSWEEPWDKERSHPEALVQ